MKYQHKSQAMTRLFSPAVLALALLCWGSVALAGEPGPGVDVSLNKNPGGSVAKGQSDANGNYLFSNLAPGKYELCIGGKADKACKTVAVGKEGVVKGQVQKSTGNRVTVTPNAPVVNTKLQLRAKVAQLPFNQATYNRARAKDASLPATQALFQQNVNDVVEKEGWRICADNIHFCGCSGIIDCALMGVLNDMVDDA